MSLLDALMSDKGIIVKFKADLTELQWGMDKARYKLTEWRDDTNKHTSDMTKWGAAIGATVAPILAVGTAVYATQQKFGAMANEIDDLATTTGLSVEKIQQLQYAAVLSGDSFPTVATGINYLTLSMQKAGDATSEAGKAFAALGVSVAGRSPDQVFEDTTAALMRMENTTRRNEIAMAIYGRAWKDMLPYMEDYIKNKEKIQATPTFSKQDLQDLQDAKKAWDDLGNSVTIYSGKALIEVQRGMDLLLTMDSAYRKLGVGNVQGFLNDAAAYRQKQVEIEAQKLEDLIARNGGGSPNSPGASLPETNGSSFADRVEAITDAWKDYRAAIEDVNDEMQELTDINKNYTRDLQLLDSTDVQGFINLRLRHQWAVEDQTTNVNTAQARADVAQAGLEGAGRGVAGVVIQTLNVYGDGSFEKTIHEQRIRAGVPMR